MPDPILDKSLDDLLEECVFYCEKIALYPLFQIEGTYLRENYVYLLKSLRKMCDLRILQLREEKSESNNRDTHKQATGDLP